MCKIEQKLPKTQNFVFAVAPPSGRFDWTFQAMFQVDMWAYHSTADIILFKKLWFGVTFGVKP